MKELKRTVVSLTIKYSLLFFICTWSLSGGIYLWINNSLGEGYLNRLNSAIEQTGDPKERELTPKSAAVLADVTIDRLRDILLAFNGVALVVIPLIAYSLSRRTIAPMIKSQEEERQFVANASHELRTPLAVMLAELEWALKKQRTDREYTDTIQNVRQEVAQMSDTITGLLNVSQLHDRAIENMTGVHLDNVVTSALERYKVQAEHKRISFDSSILPTIVRGRPELLSSVINNLIDNAVKYAEPSTVISLKLFTEANMAVTVITNTTTESDEQLTSRLFDRYYRRSNVVNGYGLGLSIVRQIVAAHRGTIEVSIKNGLMKIIIRLETYEDK